MGFRWVGPTHTAHPSTGSLNYRSRRADDRDHRNIGAGMDDIAFADILRWGLTAVREMDSNSRSPVSGDPPAATANHFSSHHVPRKLGLRLHRRLRPLRGNPPSCAGPLQN